MTVEKSHWRQSWERRGEGTRLDRRTYEFEVKAWDAIDHLDSEILGVAVLRLSTDQEHAVDGKMLHIDWLGDQVRLMGELHDHVVEAEAMVAEMLGEYEDE